jgi:SEC-C motif-containing protein
MRPADCKCHSGKRYLACCQPLHDGARGAATPEELMRSRYAAFALGLGTYLVETLSAGHPDREDDEAALAAALARIKETRRFLGLTILESSVDGDRGRVVFHARVFERGANRSFTERSLFAREAGLWRYTGIEDDG